MLKEVNGTKIKAKLAIAFLFLFLAIAGFSIKTFADTSTGQVAVTNVAPSVSSITLWNEATADSAITLTAGSNITVMANATITDTNGGGDISSANATLFNYVYSNESGPADENYKVVNSSCGLSAASGNTKTATCTFTLGYMITNGTWTANITAWDFGSTNLTASGADNNTVNTLASLDVLNATIDHGTLSLGTNSSASKAMTVISLSNLQMDSRFSGTNFSCTVGAINVSDTRYSLTSGDYDSMSTDLTNATVTQSTFDLGVRGIATAEGTNSTKDEFWTIKLASSGIGGTCTNTLYVTAIAS